LLAGEFSTEDTLTALAIDWTSLRVLLVLAVWLLFKEVTLSVSPFDTTALTVER
jgi:hypothetical protein